MWWFGAERPFPVYKYIGLMLALIAQTSALLMSGSFWVLISLVIFIVMLVLFFMPAMHMVSVLKSMEIFSWENAMPYTLLWQVVPLAFFGLIKLLTGSLGAELTVSFQALVATMLIFASWIFLAFRLIQSRKI